MPIFNALGSRAEAGRTLGNIGKLLNAQNKPELAITFLKASVNVRESIRGDIRGLDTALQQSFTDTVANDYRLLADLLLSQGRLLEAEQVLELLKIQEIREYTRGTVYDPNTRQVTLSPLEAEILKEYDSLIAFGQQVVDVIYGTDFRDSNAAPHPNDWAFAKLDRPIGTIYGTLA